MHYTRILFMLNPGKERRDTENYEKYWKITLAFTDINGDKFLGTLKIIKEFIDQNRGELQRTESQELYEELQKKVNEFNPMWPTSIRKSINQFVKIGFINFSGRGYHQDLEKFLNANTENTRKIIFSKIIYENSNFQSSWTNADSKKGHIKFLIKTLEKIKRLCREDIIALMRVDITKFQKGFLTRQELDEFIEETEDIDFIDRKYNQLSHFRSILARLDDLSFVNYHPHGQCLHFKEYADEQFPDRWKHEGRDPYLQGRYRSLLIQEVKEKCGSVQCMVSANTGNCIASHMKPFSRCTKDEAYDENNGIYISEEIDYHFDKGRISFNDDGTIIFGKDFPDDQKDNFKDFCINSIFLNERRLKYLDFHRKSVMENK
jgi:putative restriction endonuclease